MPFTPSAIFDIAVLEADDIAGIDGDAVSLWTAQSGSISVSPFQSTSNKQPVLKKGANGLNSKNIVLFDIGDVDGIPNNLVFGDLTELDFGTGAFSIFAVVRATTSTGAWLCKDNSDGLDNGIFFYSSGGNFSYYNGTAGITIGTSDSSYHLLGVTRASTAANALIPYYDGTAATSGTESRTLSNAKTCRIGNSSDETYPMDGKIAAIYIASSVPSTANRNAFGGYIQTKYGLTIAGATFDAGTVIEVQTAVTNVP